METCLAIIIVKLVSNIEVSHKCLLNERKNSSITDEYFKMLRDLHSFVTDLLAMAFLNKFPDVTS